MNQYDRETFYVGPYIIKVWHGQRNWCWAVYTYDFDSIGAGEKDVHSQALALIRALSYITELQMRDKTIDERGKMVALWPNLEWIKPALRLENTD
jgi:lysophospholipid acyltransferase (LPLAT)-like uncharacterized protein